MNKKGLTLVELLATVVILSAISLIIVPNVISSIRRSDDRVYDTQIANIESAAKNWTADKVSEDGCVADVCSTETQDSAEVTLKTLQEGGYIAEDLENPKSGNLFNPETTRVIVSFVDNDYTYQVLVNES